MPEAKPPRAISDVLREADETLQVARHGLEDFLHGKTPSRRLAGLRNVVVWGRAVTNVLQNLRAFGADQFDNWYEPRQAHIKDDVDFRYLYDLRSQVLKEGVLGGMATSMYIEYFNTGQIAELGPPPAGATGFFMGDSLGGSGWTVKLADGTEERYYVDLPTHWQMRTEIHFVDVTKQLKLPPPKTPIDRLLSDYIDFLARLVAEARQEFVATSSTS